MPRLLVEHSFWVLSVRMFLDETSIWICRLSKTWPYQCGWASPSLLRAPLEQKGRGRVDLLSARPTTSNFSCPQISKLLVLIPLDLDSNLDHWLPWFLGLVFELELPLPHQLSTSLHNHWDNSTENNPFCIQMYISHWFCFFGEP